MTEQTGLRNNALPYPVYGVPWGVVFPMLDADGDLVTAATTPTATRSLNGDTFATCTNSPPIEIATGSGMYYILLTAAEMTADVLAILGLSATSGMKTTPIVLYPAKLVSLRSGTAQAGASGTITLDSSASEVDDFYNGCLIVTTGGTGSGQARMCSDYVGSTKVASVAVNWATTPSSSTTFVVYQPWGRQFTDVASVVGAVGSVTGNVGGNVTGNVTGTLGGMTAAALADFFDTNSGTTYASAVAGSVIKELADNAGTLTAASIADAVWDEATTSHTTSGTFGEQCKTDIDAILVDTGTTLDTAIAALPTANANADALLDRANAVETGLTPRNAFKLIAAATAGKLSGGATTTNTIRNAVADSKNRIVATVDTDGNRTAITYDVT